MKVVILAGGLGTRLSEETELKPKPMVEIGGQPILWHIMKHYAHYDFNEFFIALGHRGEMIKRFFVDYCSLRGNMTLDLAKGVVDTQNSDCEDWIVHLKNTGQETNTGGRVKRLQAWLKDGTFMATYGDGVSDVNLAELLQFHRAHGRIATVTAVRPPARFGGLVFDGDLVAEFTEKPQIGEGWINGGFMVFEPAVFDYLESDQSSLESDALEQLATDKQLVAYRHEAFWQCMDTMREVRLLETLWRSGKPPWKTWQ
ncbi:MAG TPA: glucose-1-phosphate cytidylyltransferase [Pyrinomonadaceae bacterium]|jgi:glucose-1-phosphate cytidylyltransferase|nr:glucose-1-phosphate cytidylyltransferase [Pyrinomonadaceae bacterium]